MAGVLIGFAIIGTVIALGYVVGRSGILGETAPFVLSRIVFFVLSPSLLFTVLADSDVHALFSTLLVVSALAAIFCVLLFASIAIFFWRRKVPETVIGSLASGYTNANNIGIPVAFYVLGNTAYAAPVILLQLLVLAPISLTILDITTRDITTRRGDASMPGAGAGVGAGTRSRWRALVQPFRNPMLIGSALGALLSATSTTLPAEVMEPFRLIGAAAVPVVLISFGMSLHGRKILEAGTRRRDVILASGIKVLVMPVVAWLLGDLLFALNPEQLFAVVVLAALPTAQNVFVYAQRYERGVTMARDTVLITTIASVPVLVAAAALLV
jgi:predicted permease